MPLTAKGQDILTKMEERYGEAKGKSVFYASRNKGTISGVDSAVAGAGPESDPASLDRAAALCDAYDRKHGCG